MSAQSCALMQQLGHLQARHGLQQACLASDTVRPHGGVTAMQFNDRGLNLSLSQAASQPRHQGWLSTSGPSVHHVSRRLSTQCSVAERSLPVGEVEQVDAPEPVDDELLSSINEWELDFCSRPILDDRGRRMWELLVCDSTRTLEHAEYFPSNRINSATLKDALVSVMEQYGVPKPEKVRFFRAQMQTIISKACSELDIRPVPSQRCIALVQWLEDRFETVYAQHPNYQEGASPLLTLEPKTAQNLPDSLKGEQWAFVQLPLGSILEELERVDSGEVFGASLDLAAMGIGSLSADAMVPGVAVASTRATPLAAWTSALELAALRVDVPRGCLVLGTGVADQWRYAFYRRSQSADAEANAWEAAKKQCRGLHFLAIQDSLESEDCAGFWLMRDLPSPQI